MVVQTNTRPSADSVVHSTAPNRRRPLLIVITGPTASGKTDLAIALAQHYECDIISADSRQIYRGIPIGTAAPSAEQLSAVTHHLVDELELDEYYSAARFERDALSLLPSIFSRSKGIAIVCGGSMMYVDALTNGIDDIPDITPPVRDKVAALAREQGREGLLAFLEIIDPKYRADVDPFNVKRIVHAIEVTMQAGRPYSTLRTGNHAERDFDIIKLAYDIQRETLFERINRRVDTMMDAGLLDEARRVYPLRHLNSLNTVGYKELFAYFDGEMDFDTAVARIKKNTRVYAKKQLTWLRRDNSVNWLCAGTPISEVIDIIDCK